jgi:hypothetical protein
LYIMDIAWFVIYKLNIYISCSIPCIYLLGKLKDRIYVNLTLQLMKVKTGKPKELGQKYIEHCRYNHSIVILHVFHLICAI